MDKIPSDAGPVAIAPMPTPFPQITFYSATQSPGLLYFNYEEWRTVLPYQDYSIVGESSTTAHFWWNLPGSVIGYMFMSGEKGVSPTSSVKVLDFISLSTSISSPSTVTSPTIKSTMAPRPGSTSMVRSTPTARLPSSSALTTATTNAHTSFSSGAKVGIGIGAAFGAVLIASFIFLYLRRKRKQQYPGIPEMSGHSPGLKTFLGGKWRAEASGESEPAELDSRNVLVIPGPPAELEGSKPVRIDKNTAATSQAPLVG